jgi:segregation and condensation protein B
VDAGPVLRSLLQRHLIRIAGHREVPGRPIIYATTRRFLEVFGLAKLGDLPTLRDLAQLAPDAETEAEPAGFGESAGEADAPVDASEAADEAAQEEGAEPVSDGEQEQRESTPAPPLAPPPCPTH